MEWLAITVITMLLTGWIGYRLHRPISPVQRREATIAALRKSRLNEIDRQVSTPGYLHLRHHLRKVLLPADKVLLLAEQYAESATAEQAAALTQAIAGLDRACAELRQATD